MMKISFCTVCMNRLHHLRQTLPANIAGNMGYPNLEFVLLDYNSADGMEAYVKETLHREINAGKVVYYRMTEAPYFKRSHSRNVAFQLASGDILCNVDADNFTGKDFAVYVEEILGSDERGFLTTIGPGGTAQKDVLGRICVRRQRFMEVDGFDESMEGYGFEDFDMVHRLELIGGRRIVLQEQTYLEAIRHPNRERISDEYTRRHFHRLLVSYQDPSRTEVIVLFNDGNFVRGTLLDMKTRDAAELSNLFDGNAAEYRFGIIGKEWRRGSWYSGPQALVLNEDSYFERLILTAASDSWRSGDTGRFYWSVPEEATVEQLLLFYSEITNRMKMQRNKEKGHHPVNSNEFGKAVVFKNFNYQIPVFL